MFDWQGPRVPRRLCLLSAVTFAQRAFAQEHHHLMGVQQLGVPTPTPADATRIAQSLASPVDQLHGLAPHEFLERFERGTQRRLPDGRVLREFSVTAEDREIEVAPGVRFPAWTYNGSVPGPTLRCTEGDFVRVHFCNRSKAEHTIHFHGIHSAAMDGAQRMVKPGDEFVYEFVAKPAGLHLYHCHVPPVHLHMGRGLFGIFLVDPRRPRPSAREMVMVLHAWDLDFDGKNELYAMNGGANYYRDHPIPLRVGEFVRMYVTNTMEHEPISSFHLHAAFFSALRATSPTHEERDYTDVITLSQAERRIIEFSYEHAGLFMFHPHQNAVAERGCMGHFDVRL